MKKVWFTISLSFVAALSIAGTLAFLGISPFFPVFLATFGVASISCAMLARDIVLARHPPEPCAFIQGLIDAIPEPVYIKDANARFLWINRAFAQERRRAAEEIVGKTSYDLAPDETAARLVTEEDTTVLRGGEIFKEQHTTYPVTGEECYRLVSKRLCRMPDGTPLIIGAHFDITRMRQAEMAMQEALDREIAQRQRAQTYIQRLINVIPQPVYIKDSESRYLLVNEAFCTHRKLAAEELLGKSPFDLSKDPEHAKRVVAEDMDVLAGRIVVKEECMAHPVTGENVYRYISKGTCLDADGKPVIVGANFDITAWRVAELRWKHASAAKSQFLASMSHEIRTPLSGVIGTLQIVLRDNALGRDTREYVATSLSNAESLLGIINDILDFSKIEAGELKLEHIDFDLHATAREALQTFAEHADSHDLVFRLDIDPVLPQYLKGDPTRVRQILINLVGNAVKFTEKGTISIRMHGEPLVDGRQHIVCSVSDTGIGIPTETIPKLFQMFQQADTSTTRRYGGTGLGLAICRQLVEAMDGTIGVASEVGRGSTFTFDLKLDAGTPPHKEDDAPLPPHGRRLRILCAEDVRVNQLIIRAQLTHFGHEVEIVDNGQKAIEALAERDFDLVLMDGRMPVLDGADATRAIRTGGLPGFPVRQPGIHIVALTANASKEDRDEYLAAGMDDFLTKPVRERDVHAILSHVIERLESAPLHEPDPDKPPKGS